MEREIMFSFELLLRLKEQAKDDEFNRLFKKIKSLAKEGNTVAQHTLWECYAYNICKNDIELDDISKSILNRSTEENSVDNAMEYLFGFNDTDKCIEKAISILEDNIQDPKARFILAMCYLNGTGKEFDPSQAFILFKQSAECGLSEAQLWVGNCLWDGIGISQDKREAFLWLEKSAEQCDNQALLNLGYCYDHGIDGFLEIDKDKALELYKRAAWFGNPMAADNIRIISEELLEYQKIYENGKSYIENVPPKTKQAQQCFEECVKINYKPALVRLGIINYERRKYQEAIKYFMKCGDDDIARYYLGLFYEKGFGIEANIDKAKEYYSLSYYKFAQDSLKRLTYTPEQSYQDAFAYFENKEYKRCIEAISKFPDYSYNQNLLGLCYWNGHGVEQNHKKAFELISKSANQNNPNGIFHLGLCYLVGVGVEKNERSAFEYINQAADMDHLPAKNRLGICYIYGKYLGKDIYKGLSLVKYCIDKGYIPANKDMADCCLKGVGVEKNIEEAKKYFRTYLNKYADTYVEGQYLSTGGKVFSRIQLSEYDLEQIKFYSQIGVPIAKTFYAMAHLTGYHVAKDYHKAISLLEEVVEEESLAQVILGICYDSGIGVDEDKIVALKLFTKSAQNGNCQGMYNLAVYYWNGECEGFVDKDKAIELLGQSSEHYSASKTMLEKIMSEEEVLKFECTKIEELVEV